MNWTAIIFEYLAIGVMTLVWVFLLVLRFEGIDARAAIGWANESASNFGLLMLGLVAAYSIGIVVDKVLHWVSEPFLKWRVRRLWRKHFREATEDENGRRFYAAEDALIAGTDGELGRLQRRRGRIRILRALIVSVPLILLGLGFHYIAPWLFAIGILFEVLIIIAFLDAHKEYIRMVARKARTLTP